MDTADRVVRKNSDAAAVTGAEGLKALHLIEGIYLSNHRRVPVRLPLDADAAVETFDTRA